MKTPENNSFIPHGSFQRCLNKRKRCISTFFSNFPPQRNQSPPKLDLQGLSLLRRGWDVAGGSSLERMSIPVPQTLFPVLVSLPPQKRDGLLKLKFSKGAQRGLQTPNTAWRGKSRIFGNFASSSCLKEVKDQGFF